MSGLKARQQTSTALLTIENNGIYTDDIAT